MAGAMPWRMGGDWLRLGARIILAPDNIMIIFDLGATASTTIKNLLSFKITEKKHVNVQTRKV